MGLNRDYLNTKCIAGNFKVCVWGQIKLDRLFSLSLIGFPTDNQPTAIFIYLFCLFCAGDQSRYYLKLLFS